MSQKILLPYYGVKTVMFVQPIFNTLVLKVTVPLCVPESTDIDLFVVPVVHSDACISVITDPFWSGMSFIQGSTVTLHNLFDLSDG